VPAFQDREPTISASDRLRIPQREAYAALADVAPAADDRELGVVLPVGCGKSGLIAITPFAFLTAGRIQNRRRSEAGILY
jgi:hypothetical protein